MLYFFVIPRQNMSDFIEKRFSWIYRTPVNPTELENPSPRLQWERWTENPPGGSFDGYRQGLIGFEALYDGRMKRHKYDDIQTYIPQQMESAR